MSDYPNPNIHRGDGVSGKAILIAILAIGAIVLLLALVGSGTGTVPVEGGAVAPEAAPAAPATDPAPAVTE